HVADFLDDENRKIFEENFKKALRGERCVYELVRLRKDGGKVYTLTSSAPLLIEGKVKGTFAVITDITDLKRTESKLRESELKYSTIVEKGPEGVVIIQDGIIKFVNRRLSEITGIKVEEYLGSSYLNFIAPEYQELAAERYTKRMSGVKVPDRYEIELIGRDGRHIPFEIIATVIDYEGRPADMVILRDITERRKADQMLRESEEKYRSLVESSSDSIYMLDRDLRYIQVNQELLKRLGLPQEKVVGKTFGELHSAEETREFEAKAREVFETGKVVQQEHYHARLGRYFLRTISPVRDPKSGEIKAIIVVGKDITELKQALENLKKSEEEYRSLAENVADILLRIDLNGNCTYVSKSAFEETGYTIEDAKKLNIKDILTPESYETALARIKMWKSGTRKLPPWVAEIKSKDGRIVPYELKTSPIFENGKLSGIQIIARNVSERIAAMQAIEHARAYAESIVEAVHEPLVVLDADMKVISANRAFYECFQVTPEETEKYSLYELGNKQWDIPELRKLLNDVVEKNISFKEYVVVHDFPRIGRKIMMLNAKQMRTKEGGKPMVLLAIEDITERHLMETQLRRSSEIQSAIVSLLSLPLNYSMEEILKRALKTILSLSWLNLEQRGSIFLADDEQNTLVLKTQHKVPEILQTCSTVPFGRCLCGRAAATKKIIFTDHVDENHETKYEGIRPHGHYCVPILTDDKVVGVIDLYIQEGHRQDEAEMEFLKAAANALALIITRKNFELEQLKFIYRINEISKGECYLYRSHRAAYNIASHLMLLGVPGICFTREDPEKLIEYRIPKENIIIISSVPLKGYDTTDNLQEISMRIGEFIRNNRGSIVLLDGLEYLVSRFGFDMTYKFLQEKRFQFIENDAILLMPVELNIFSEREKALFASEVKIIG
ncbi:MAG: PAS domain S-box protein, partial [Candidatus Hadarchaeum sp.]|uniref:PAS domain S-box protein n=1 Tax=Candidatus Hadarchaeum sp. TaxID=2883567 RepID=UPI0031743D08